MYARLALRASEPPLYHRKGTTVTTYFPCQEASVPFLFTLSEIWKTKCAARQSERAVFITPQNSEKLEHSHSRRQPQVDILFKRSSYHLPPTSLPVLYINNANHDASASHIHTKKFQILTSHYKKRLQNRRASNGHKRPTRRPQSVPQFAK